MSENFSSGGGSATSRKEQFEELERDLPRLAGRL